MEQYKHWRNKVNSLIRLYKKDFFSKAIIENKDSAYIWKHIKNLGSQTGNSSLPDELKIGNVVYNTQEDIIQKLNSYFANISDTLKTSNKTVFDSAYDFSKLQNHIETLIPYDVHFNIPKMKLHDLINSIKSLDCIKTTGLDGLSPRILKLSAGIASSTLLDIINKSIQNGQFPDILKITKLLPIHKDGTKDNPSNYRPISILPVISKLIEKHVTKHLFAFLNKYQVLHKSQSGFRKDHSCNTALINLVDKWLKHIDNGEVVGAIFFDIRKAFDVVDHELLLAKLSIYKFSQSALDWVKSYLTNRKQCITERNFSSHMQTVKSGVPQGSVLGPVLFLLFINDLPLLTQETGVDIYADDTTIHAAHKDRKTVKTRLQIGALGFRNWCSLNKMYINMQKTTQMILGTQRNLNRSEHIEVYLDQELVQLVKNKIFLGLLLMIHFHGTTKLKWSVSISHEESLY